MNKLVALIGMCGSGKSIASDYYVDRGYKKVYFGKITFDKLKEAGLEITPDNEKMMRERIREQYGMDAYAKLAISEIKDNLKNGNVVIDGLYSWDELKFLKEVFPYIKVIAVIVDKNIRYERIGSRKDRAFSKEDAIVRDISEIENLHKAEPIAFADYYILNNSDIEKYYDRLDEITNLIEKED